MMSKSLTNDTTKHNYDNSSVKTVSGLTRKSTRIGVINTQGTKNNSIT